MATRSRSFMMRKSVKAVSFALCVALLLAAASVVIWMTHQRWQDPFTGRESDYGDYLSLSDFGASRLLSVRSAHALDLIVEASGWRERDTDAVLADKEENFERLGALPGIYYWVSTKHMVLSNTSLGKDFFRSHRFRLIVEDYAVTEGTLGWYYSMLGDMVSDSDAWDSGTYVNTYGDTFYFCFDNALAESWEAEFNEKRMEVLRYAIAVLLLLLLSLACLIHLILVAGRRPDGSEVEILWYDRIWWEVQIGLLILLITLTSIWIEGMGSSLLFSSASYPMILIPLGVIYVLLIAFLLSVAKWIKRREAWRGSLCLILLRALWGGLRSFAGAFMRSIPFSVGVAGGLLVISVLNGLFYNTAVPALLSLAAIVPAVLWANRLNNIMKGAKAVKSGRLDEKIQVKGLGHLASFAEDINSISEGMRARVDSELRAERMKTELITNVSHDLRTPLTSVLTYVDLLKSEGLDSPDAPRYLEVVEQKAARLKQLTDDLFEAAKASSGNITPVFEVIELRALVEQSLGELSVRIDECGFDFRVSGGPVPVRADGKMLWRCLENLLNNIFKYALQNSRVYINMSTRDGMGCLVMKNISAYELGIEASELTERFTRGDSARAGEGSGLGLAIVQDFIRLQNGRFEIEVDGDLFKTTILLPAAEMPPAEGETESDAEQSVTALQA